MEVIRCSRALLMPGPMGPVTHLGITLQRHVVVSGLRYTLYHLGFPVPERSPIKIVQLRLYLDAEALREHLGDQAGAEEIVGALCDPRGSIAAEDQTGEVAAAAVFHRLRLTTVRRRRPKALAETVGSENPWTVFRAGVTRWLDVLNDAFLTEFLTSRSRRRRRGEDKTVEATLPREAWRFHGDRDCRLDCLGPTDLYEQSWSLDHEARDLARQRIADDRTPKRDTRRGVFREAYREMLSQLRIPYLALADTAHERGILDHPDDAFFIPFDLASDLATPERPGWLEEAVTSNRREYDSYLETAPPSDLLDSSNPVVSSLEKRAEQAWNCLLPIE